MPLITIITVFVISHFNLSSSSDLVGTVINVNSGDWVRRDSGVGAGIDSYYEYCLKGYILLGEDAYLERFERHYAAVMKYISQVCFLLSGDCFIIG